MHFCKMLTCGWYKMGRKMRIWDFHGWTVMESHHNTASILTHCPPQRPSLSDNAPAGRQTLAWQPHRRVLGFAEGPSARLPGTSWSSSAGVCSQRRAQFGGAMDRRRPRAAATVALRGGADDTAGEKGGTPGSVLPPKQRGALLLLLLLVYVHNQWTRNALMYAVNYSSFLNLNTSTLNRTP